MKKPKWPSKEFFDLPLPEQRRLLGLREGQNPPCPPWMKMPKPIIVPKAKYGNARQ